MSSHDFTPDSHYPPRPPPKGPGAGPAPLPSNDSLDDERSGNISSKGRKHHGDHRNDVHPPPASARQDAQVEYTRKSEPRQMRQSMRETRREQTSSGWGFGNKLSRMGFWQSPTYDDPSQWQENHEDQHSQRRAPQGPDPYVEANRLREQNANYVQIIQQLQTSLEEKQAINDKVKQSANKMQLAMDNKELFVGVQHTDDVVLGKFQNLLGQIKTWSTKFVNNGSLEFERLDTRTASQFRLVAPGRFNSPDSGQLFDSGKKRRMFIRGWVALVMTEEVFRALPNTQNPISSSGDRWMGKQLESSVTLIEDRLSHADPSRVSPRDLHDWRALTVELLSRIDLGRVAKQEMEDFLKAHSRGIMQVIGDWAPPDMKIELEESIFNIFHSAVQFSQLIRRQRACWYVRGPAPAVHFDGQTQSEVPHDIVFDKTCMQDDDDVDEGYGQDSEEKARKIVELFICPGLFKRGNADGERFDTESCIVQQLVLCREI